MESPSLLVSSCDDPGSGIDFSLHLSVLEDNGKVPGYLTLALTDEPCNTTFNLSDDLSNPVQIDVANDTSSDVQILYPLTSDQNPCRDNSLTKVLRSFKKTKLIESTNVSSQIDIPGYIGDAKLPSLISENEISSGVDVPYDSRGEACDKSTFDTDFCDTEDKFECKECGRKFKERRNLASHVRAHISVRKYMCSECGKCFKTKSNLKVHLSIHSDSPFTCEICSKTFDTRNKLHRHCRVTHWNNHFECSHCGKVLKSERSLRTHSASHSTSSKPFLCTFCTRGFIFKNTLLAHIKLKHSCSACSQSGSLCSAHAVTCDQCGKSFSCRASLTSHVRKHSSAKPYQCSTCDESYAKKDSLDTHVKRVHYKELPQFICDKCSLGYYTKFSLQRHYAKHTSTKAFICELCKRSFWTKDALKTHGQSHELIKKFACPMCGKRFTHKHSVVAHVRTHESGGRLPSKSSRPSVKSANHENKNSNSIRKVPKENPSYQEKPSCTPEAAHQSFIESPQAVPLMGDWMEHQPKSPIQTIYASPDGITYQDLSHSPFL